jgi:hypothetical protein
MTPWSLRNRVYPDGDEGNDETHQRDPLNKERALMQIRKTTQSMTLIAIILLSTVAAVAGNIPTHNSPLRMVHGTVVDAKGKTVAASVVYLHNEQTHAVKTYVTDHHGRYRFSGIRFHTDYRIHAEHKGRLSAVRRIPAHSTNKLIKLDLKLDSKRSVSASFVEPDPLFNLVIQPEDRSSKRVRLQVPVSGTSTI